MKICVNALLVDPGVTGGGETFLVNLMRCVGRQDKDNQYLILVTKRNRQLFADCPAGECRTIPGVADSRLLRLLFENLLLPFYLLFSRVDLYYSPFGALPLLLFCKSVVTIQNLIYLDFRRNVPYRGRTWRSHFSVLAQALYYKLLTPLTLRQADKIWSVSRTATDQLSQRYSIDPAKIETIHEGVAFERFHPNRSAKLAAMPSEAPYIVSVANLYPNKNLDRLIAAFHSVVANGYPHRLIIIGSDWHGYRSVLEQQVHELHLDGRVSFTGGLPQDQVPKYLHRADLFVLISTVESFGLPVLEAMAAGVPVIISDSSALPEIAGDAALTVSCRSTTRLAEQMIRVLMDRKLAQRLRERGFQRARNFDWTETAARAIDLFNRVGASTEEVSEVSHDFGHAS